MKTEKINEIQNESRAIFELLQQLNAPMTENNIVILNACLGSLKLIGQICEEEKNTVEEVKENAGEANAE